MTSLKEKGAKMGTFACGTEFLRGEKRLSRAEQSFFGGEKRLSRAEHDFLRQKTLACGK